MRILRAAIGLMALIQAFQQQAWALGIAGAIVFGMAVMNVGCCGTAGCSVPYRPQAKNNTEDVVYEEVDTE